MSARMDGRKVTSECHVGVKGLMTLSIISKCEYTVLQVDYLVNMNDEADSSDSEYDIDDYDDEDLVWEEDGDGLEEVEEEDEEEEEVEETVDPKVNNKEKNNLEEEDESGDEEDDSDSEEEEDDDGLDSLAEDSEEDEEESVHEGDESNETGKEKFIDRDSGIDADPSRETGGEDATGSETSGATKAQALNKSGAGTSASALLGVRDEYEYDSSDEEDLRNTIGNVPINWYDDYPHIGYNHDGNPILKPEHGDALDKFLNKLENPDFNRTVFDKLTGQEVRLSDEDLDIIKRVMGRRVPDKNFEVYPKFLDLFSHEVMEMPLSGRPEHKRSFIPSRKDAAYVAHRAMLIRRGLIKYNTKKKEDKNEFNYDLWHDEGTKIRGIYNHMPAPKRKLPGKHNVTFMSLLLFLYL